MSPRRPHDWNDEPPERPRILIECPPESSPSIIAEVVRREGMAVRVCGGPDTKPGCSLLDDGTCTLAAGADVVVNMLGQNRTAGRDVAAAVRAERRPPAMVIEMSGMDVGRPDVDAAGAVVLPRSFTATKLLDAIRRAPRGARGRAATVGRVITPRGVFGGR